MEEPRLHVSMAGFAAFLVINASQAWGGIFPFLPMSFQTDAVTLIFYFTQALSFFATYAVSAIGAYYYPGRARHMMVGIVTLLVFVGSAAIIAAMYVPSFTMALIVAGGLCLGIGCAGMFMLWQRYFASISPSQGNLRLIVGTALASIIYFALYLIPTALTAFLVPVVLLPLSSLALTLSIREMSFDQPMFEDIPREHPQVYQRVMHDTWRPIIGVAAIAFTSGLARGVALLNPDVNAVVNVSSMLGSFIAAVALLLAWRMLTVRFSMDIVFRFAFPILATGLLFFPFMQSGASLSLFAGITYMAFSMVVVVMMMQSAQISRDRGVNPVFSYGFMGSVAYGIQSAGFLLGWLLYDGILPGVGSVEFLSLLAFYALGAALFVSNRLFKFNVDASDSEVELIRLRPPRAAHDALDDPADRMKVDAAAEYAALDSGLASRVPAASLESNQDEEVGDKLARRGTNEPDAGSASNATHRPSKANRNEAFTDRLSKQCYMLRGEYGLTKRETEVMEAIARGLSMASIAEELFISENTVRTHAKHIYAKLDIHSRQELGSLLQNVDVNF